MYTSSCKMSQFLPKNILTVEGLQISLSILEVTDVGVDGVSLSLAQPVLSHVRCAAETLLAPDGWARVTVVPYLIPERDCYWHEKVF